MAIIGTSQPAAETQHELTASWLPGVKEETSLVGTPIMRWDFSLASCSEVAAIHTYSHTCTQAGS